MSWVRRAVFLVLLCLSGVTLSGQDEVAASAEIVYPNKEADASAVGRPGLDGVLSQEKNSVGLAVTLLGYLIVFGGLCVCVWFLFKRGLLRKPGTKGEGKLRVMENRMLGNRQFLMVVQYEDQKILLGVGPGKIDYLTSLNSTYRDNDSRTIEDQFAQALERREP